VATGSGASRSDARATPSIIGVVGPTASGKSDLALALATRLPVEILVADSRQVVRGMDVGTAAPDAAARAAVPHHLLDLVEPDEPFTVADWVRMARPLVEEIAARGRIPMVVGGTGLYVEALVEGHDYAAESRSADLRAELTDRLVTDGLGPLVDELAARDPDTAAVTDLRNPRRVVRALERATLAGGPVRPSRQPYPGRVALVAPSRPRTTLYRRIDERARAMFTTGGLLDEVRALQARGFGPELRPMTGHGYREAAAVLAGTMGVEAAIEQTARGTRQYAKRQLSWFGRMTRVMWLPMGEREADDPAVVAQAERVLRAALS
jgi:tRNA dimethylallyltransferase